MPSTPKKLAPAPRLQAAASGMEGQASTTQGAFAGLTICVTGLSREARKQVQLATERMGGKYSPDLNPDCTHLVVQSCTGLKFEHALSYGLDRGLQVVTLSWFVNSAKLNERLDESLYHVTKSGMKSVVSEGGPQREILIIKKGYSCLPSKQQQMKSPTMDLHSALQTEEEVDLVKNRGIRFSGSSFYVDPDLSSDVQLKVIQAVTKHGATCVPHWYLGCNATHAVCEGNSLHKFMGYVTSIVSPLWVMKTVKERSQQCLIHISADLAMHLAFLLDTAPASFQKQSNPLGNDQVQRNIASFYVTDDERERIEKMESVKTDVRRRRGARMQPCRTLPRPLTPPRLLDSICWSISEQSSLAWIYIGNGVSSKASCPDFDEKDYYENRGEAELNALEFSEAHKKVMSESEEEEIVYKSVFLTILFPIDRFDEMGPSSRTFFSAKGFSRKLILDHIHEFYKEYLSSKEIQVAVYTDSRHADRLRAAYIDPKYSTLGYVPVKRCDFIGSRKKFKGLQRIGKENTSQIYELCLGI